MCVNRYLPYYPSVHIYVHLLRFIYLINLYIYLSIYLFINHNFPITQESCSYRSTCYPNAAQVKKNFFPLHISISLLHFDIPTSYFPSQSPSTLFYPHPCLPASPPPPSPPPYHLQQPAKLISSAQRASETRRGRGGRRRKGGVGVGQS